MGKRSKGGMVDWLVISDIWVLVDCCEDIQYLIISSE